DAGLYFNMAVTYQESLKDTNQARQALKKSIALDPERAESDLLLGQLFQTGGYRTQAVLTLSRFLILSPSSNRSLQAYGLWRALLRGTADTALTGTMKTPEKPATIDEGDFSKLDAFIDVTQKQATAELDKGTPDTMALVGQVDAFFGRLEAESGSVRGSFVGARYVPYFIELKAKGYVEPFVYWASQRAPLVGAREWVDANRSRVQEFLTWSESYRWPKE
ncbi:MAG TPA: hypothetical protein VJP86_00275, partial [Vicinamibacterales bacterium]|nr:hypothetical protein [Vicinamibacterales bacterium]